MIKEKYIRNCPVCNKELKYGSNEAWNLAKRRNAKCRSCATKLYAKRIGDVSFLMNDSYESLYWIGFILADGSISNDTRLSITLSDKDHQHLEKLADKIDINCKILSFNNKNGKYNQVRLNIMHSEVVRKLVKKFDIKSNKTEFPPKTSVFDGYTKKELLSLFVGFIDGDGNIGKKHNRNDFHLRIKCHANWMGFLDYFNKKLNINAPIKINKDGHCLLQVSNFNVCKRIKAEMLELDIPYLERKWDIIDLNYFGTRNNKK